jgi:hypothetical protein
MPLQVIRVTKNTANRTFIKKCELVLRKCMESFRDPDVEKHWSMSPSARTDVIRIPQKVQIL